LVYDGPYFPSFKEERALIERPYSLRDRFLLKSAVMHRLTKGLFFLALVFLAIPASAHPVPFSFLDIQLQRSAVDISLTVHIYDVAHDLDVTPMERLLDPAILAQRTDAIRTLLTPRFQLMADGQPLVFDWSKPEILAEKQSIRFRSHHPVSAMPGMISLTAEMFPYDPNHQTFVNVYENEEELPAFQVILNQREKQMEYFAGSRQGALAVMRKFVPAGVHHILIGPDHLLFLVGLLLLGGSIRRLTMVVTSFTIAHSITLSLAALNILTPPARIIEPAIALSIVYVGADNLRAQGGRDVRAWIAFAFGFIHGFGFANVLREMNLPTRALGWSLFSFNLGVEIGQLLVVVAVASAFAALRSRSEWARRQLAYAGSIVVIVAGAVWFIQRVFFPA